MKSPYFKSLIGRVILCLAFLTAVLIIHSCRKDSKQASQLSLPTAVAQAKSWYENSYPVSALGSNGIATFSTTPSNTQMDYSQHIKPDWAHNASYTRLNKSVFEIPVDPSTKVGAALTNNGTGAIVYSKENSKTSFIILNDGKTYQAFIMVILADAAYIANDPTKLALNTYRKRDANFSGMVAYFTPKGAFISSYKYSNGKLLAPAISPTAATASLKTQGLITLGACDVAFGVKKTTNSVKQITVDYSCIDWYLNTYIDDELVDKTFLYRTCTMCDGGGGDPTGGTGGGATVTCTDTGGGGTGGGGEVDQSTGKVVNTVDTGGDGGFPEPGNGTCTVPVADLAIINNVVNPCLKAMVDSILSKNINGKIDSMIQNVFGGTQPVNLYFTDQGSMIVSTDDGEDIPSINSAGNLVADTIRLNANTLAISSREFIAATIMHEALHAYLDSKGIAIGDAQHEVMAANYVTTMAMQLMRMFPGLAKDFAYSLAWAGLENTSLYKDPNKTVYFPTSPTDPNYASEINVLFRAHTDAQNHVFGHGC